MKFRFIKLKIFPTILILMLVCLAAHVQDVAQKIKYASENKSNVSFKTSFVNEAFAATPATAKKEAGSGGDGDQKAPPPPPGLTPNKDPKNIDKAYRNNAEAQAGAAYTKEEIELLQNLSKRKLDIAKSEEELSVKAKILEANELQLSKKLDELKSLKTQLEDLLAQYHEKENMKIGSLVKIYENMKPKDAAKIFEALDMPILLQVVNVMKESKVAPILSAMDPIRAKEISTEFANQRRLVTQ